MQRRVLLAHIQYSFPDQHGSRHGLSISFVVTTHTKKNFKSFLSAIQPKKIPRRISLPFIFPAHELDLSWHEKAWAPDGRRWPWEIISSYCTEARPLINQATCKFWSFPSWQWAQTNRELPTSSLIALCSYGLQAGRNPIKELLLVIVSRYMGAASFRTTWFWNPTNKQPRSCPGNVMRSLGARRSWLLGTRTK